VAAKSLDENNAEIRINLGFALSAEKRFREAIAELQKAVELQPKDDEARYFLGELYLRAKDKKGAIEQYAKIKFSNAQLAGRLYRSIYNDRILAVSTR
jgi:Flp pilus assembly protein TadD